MPGGFTPDLAIVPSLVFRDIDVGLCQNGECLTGARAKSILAVESSYPPTTLPPSGCCV